MKLRDYQKAAVQSIWQYFKDGHKGNPLVALPTGTGKSLVIAGFIQSVFKSYPQQRILVLTHVKELIEQNYSKLIQMWPIAPAGIYSAGLKRRDLYDNVIFAGIGSVAKRAVEFGKIDLIIIDEAHLVSPNDSTMYRKFIDDLLTTNPHLKVIGLTATPYRLSHGSLIEDDGIFTDICFDMTSMVQFNWLVDQGYLTPLVPRRTDVQIDVSGVKKRGGEFIAKDVQGAADQRELTENAIQEAIEIGHDRQSWLVFTTGVEHAIHTAEILNEFGVSSKAVHSGNKNYKMTHQERDQAILDFKSGKILALVNSDVLTTGFDHPAIDMLLILKPTSSPGRWVQILGRGTRPVYADGHDLTTQQGRLSAIYHGGKHDCLVLDFAGNTGRLGPINDPVLPKKRGSKGGSGGGPEKICDGINQDHKVCGATIHAGARNCPYCGHEFVFKSKLQLSASNEELIRTESPQYEYHNVTNVTYMAHLKAGKKPSLRVTYFSGFRKFTEYIFVEHGGFLTIKARKWFRLRTKLQLPSTVSETLSLTGGLKIATAIKVNVNKKYPDIVDYRFDDQQFEDEVVNEKVI